MTAYQAGLAKFEEQGAQIIGISTDNQPAMDYWAKEVLKVGFPLAGDALNKATTDYGVLAPGTAFAVRSTFVVDVDGIIQHIEQGGGAIDPTGAVTACSRTKKTQ
jgi:alkyl hydroperoxide reductase subunit AhpC